MTFIDFKEKFQHQEVEEISYSPPQDPLVSVLVQTYQQRNFITECLESILKQETNFEYEILVGDDGSVDGTREICLKYAKKYPEKIRVFLHHRENQIKVLDAATSNFNAFYNFYLAKGKFIAFCEGDDKWTDPRKLQKQVDFLENHPHYVLAYHKFNTVDENGNRTFGMLESQQASKDLSKEELLEGNDHPLLLTICFKKDKVNIPVEIFDVLNVDTFLLSLFGEAGKAKYLNDILPSLYRFRDEGLWSNKLRSKKLISKVLTYSRLADYFGRSHNYNLKKNFLRKATLHKKMLIITHLKHKNYLLAGKSFINYIRK